MAMHIKELTRLLEDMVQYPLKKMKKHNKLYGLLKKD